MIEMESKGLATLEVSLKHSGSLFMYSYQYHTIWCVFVLGRMFCEEWGTQAANKQAEFNDFLERNYMCISMELVTAFLGDHGQCPREDYGRVFPPVQLRTFLIGYCIKLLCILNVIHGLIIFKSLSSRQTSVSLRRIQCKVIQMY
ncbi:tRNA ligase 1-like [Fagus crenata]